MKKPRVSNFLFLYNREKNKAKIVIYILEKASIINKYI